MKKGCCVFEKSKKCNSHFDFEKSNLSLLKSKRSQVTIFIIIAIVIVVAIGGLAYVYKDNLAGFFGGRFGEDVKLEVENCIYNTTMDAIYFNGLQGGYYQVDVPNIEYDFLQVPIYVAGRTLSIPSETKIEQQLAMAIEDSISFCLNKVSEKFSGKYNLGIDESGKASATISSKQIKIMLDWPISVKKIEGSETKILSKFSKTINFDFSRKYLLVKQFSQEQAKNPGEALISYMADLSYENNFVTEAIQIDETTVIYTFLFNEKYNNQSYIYGFGVKD